LILPKVAALNMLMAFVEAEALKLTQTEHHVFPNALYQRVVVALVVCCFPEHTQCLLALVGQ
jgi:hypothetical protein